MKRKALLAAGALLSAAMYGQSQAADLIGEVKPELEIRPRFDWTSKNATPGAKEDATALITRVRIGAHINKPLGIDGLKAYLELNHVSDLLDNKRTYGETNDYAFIADPSQDRLTEAKIMYTWGKTTFLFGRTRVNLDDQRFISDANWRQTPQTFGVFGIHTKEIPNLDLLLAMVYERKWWGQDGLIKTITPNSTTFVNAALTSSLDWNPDKAPIVIHGTYTFAPMLKITGYYYDITDIHKTLGANLRGDINLSKDVKFDYLAEYAKQSDPSRNKYLSQKPDVDGSFYRIYAGLSGYGFSGRIGYYTFSEYKNNGNTQGFSTPLTTFHGFEGWADVLAAGTANGFYYGLKALHASLSYTHKEWGKFDVIYYNFGSKVSAPGGKDKYGDEIDLQYTKNITKQLSVLLKGAFYNGDGTVPELNKSGTTPTAAHAKDVSKYWIMLTWKY